MSRLALFPAITLSFFQGLYAPALAATSQIAFSDGLRVERVFDSLITPEICLMNEREFFGCLMAAEALLKAIPGQEDYYIDLTQEAFVNPGLAKVAEVNSQLSIFAGDRGPLTEDRFARLMEFYQAHLQIWSAKLVGLHRSQQNFYGKMSQELGEPINESLLGSAEFIPLSLGEIRERMAAHNPQFAKVNQEIAKTVQQWTDSDLDFTYLWRDQLNPANPFLSAENLLPVVNAYLRFRSFGYDHIALVPSASDQGSRSTEGPETHSGDTNTYGVKFQMTKERIAVFSIPHFMGIDQGVIGKYNICKVIYDYWQGIADLARGVVLDLRNNPGGVLTDALCLADLMVEKGTHLLTEQLVHREEVVPRGIWSGLFPPRQPAVTHQEHFANGRKVIDKPVVVLINQASASGAEVVAGIAKAQGLGLVVGTPSFGKGSIQQVGVERHPAFSYMKFFLPHDQLAFIAHAGFYSIPGLGTPEGRGIQPDVYVSTDRGGEQGREVSSAPLFRPWQTHWLVDAVDSVGYTNRGSIVDESVANSDGGPSRRATDLINVEGGDGDGSATRPFRQTNDYPLGADFQLQIALDAFEILTQ